jgi:hypothetical protein
MGSFLVIQLIIAIAINIILLVLYQRTKVSRITGGKKVNATAFIALNIIPLDIGGRALLNIDASFVIVVDVIIMDVRFATGLNPDTVTRIVGDGVINDRHESRTYLNRRTRTAGVADDIALKRYCRTAGTTIVALKAVGQGITWRANGVVTNAQS